MAKRTKGRKPNSLFTNAVFNLSISRLFLIRAVIGLFVSCSVAYHLIPSSYNKRYYSNVDQSTLLSTLAITPTPGLKGSLQELPSQETMCHYYLAESALKKAGLGVFTTMDISEGGETHPMPDICIYVTDTPRGTQLDTHTWQNWRFHGAFEGSNPRAICEGVTTLFNSIDRVFTSIPTTVKKFIHTNGGLQRSKHPGAGAITHYYGITSVAQRWVKAGSEITIGSPSRNPPRNEAIHNSPHRSPEWLRKHGMCMDNILIQPAVDALMGRGAFASRDLKSGLLVAPAPLQMFRRSNFTKEMPEEILINYCFQPKGIDMLLYPYGAGVGLVNHSSKNPNVGIRWSKSIMHHTQWLDLPLKQFWKITYQGGLILELFALRDIEKGEELFLNYGKEWESAWKKHVRTWSPVEGAGKYVYPADMNLNIPFYTMEEQESNPYPDNLMIVCNTANWIREENTIMKWRKPRPGFQNLAICYILERKETKAGFEYTVSLQFEKGSNPVFDSSLPYIDTKVPHNAISWVDKPYKSDMYLSNAFRYPIGLPDNLVPTQWGRKFKNKEAELHDNLFINF